MDQERFDTAPTSEGSHSAATSPRIPSRTMEGDVEENQRLGGSRSRPVFRDAELKKGPSEIDYIVPAVVEKRRETLGPPASLNDRLQPTIINAELEKAKYAAKAKLVGWSLNVAIGLQVVLGALITALSAITSGKQTSIMVSILGGLSTIVASYLARCRGGNEPELSTMRKRDLDQFLREAKAYVLDNGHSDDPMHNDRLEEFRKRFEELLGNAKAQGEQRKMSTPV